jgi:[ribosomal protein S5]-alanine N-acetyltransferase
MTNLETERLVLRQLTADDAEFILELLNEPDYIKNIADRGVRTAEDARKYIENGPAASYAKNGFGLFAVTLKESGVPIGMCGLIKRDFWDDIDIGYAFLERYRGKGYAYESASAIMDYGRKVLKIKRIVAFTTLDNDASIRVLEKIGLRFEKIMSVPAWEGESRLFVPSVGE